MKYRLGHAWQSRSPQERTFIAVMAGVFAVALYLWLVLAGGQAQAQLRASVTSLQAQAARLEQQATELERLRARPAGAMAAGDLRATVEAQAAAAGYAGALIKIESADASQVAVAFGPVAFGDWLAWVGSLQSQHIRLDACRIEALPGPGMVSVTAILLQAMPQ